MSPYREVAHTADWSLEVWAETREGLFVDAARGMMALARSGADGSGGAGAPRRLRVELAGGDYESLLVSWLQELLYQAEADGWLFDDFGIESLAPERLVGWASGRPGQQPDKTIKAVTYHNLEIRQTEQGYTATLVFDV